MFDLKFFLTLYDNLYEGIPGKGLFAPCSLFVRSLFALEAKEQWM